MYPLVIEVRSSLDEFIRNYNAELSRSFNLSSMDSKFLQNKVVEDIKYFFVYTYWKLYELYFKLRKELIDNDFSKLQGLDMFFNLCLILDKLLQNNLKYGEEYLGGNVIEICDQKGWLDKNSNKKLKENLNWDTDSIDVIIPKLLSMEKMPDGTKFKKEVKYLLIAWKLRNFGGHNIHTQSILVTEFDKLCEILISCIFIAIEEI